MRVLIVDASPVARKVTQLFLTSVGFDVRGCASVPDALLALESFEPDVVLVDPGAADAAVPTLVGVAATSERRVRVILHTSEPLENTRALLARTGAHAFVRKARDGGLFYAAFCAAAGVLPTPMVAPPHDEHTGTVPELPPELRVGIPWIDAQHALLYAVHEHFEEKGLGATTDETRVFLGFLECYASFHFAAEEAILPADDPRTAQHRTEHRAFFADVRKLHHAIDNPTRGADVPRRATEYVGRWITSHVHGSDRALCT